MAIEPPGSYGIIYGITASTVSGQQWELQVSLAGSSTSWTSLFTKKSQTITEHTHATANDTIVRHFRARATYGLLSPSTFVPIVSASPTELLP